MKFDGVGADAVDVFVEEGLGADVADDVVLVVTVDVVADGMQEVGLAQTGRAVDEQRVVRAAGSFGDAQCGGERELVRRTLHECLERVARVHAAGGARHRRTTATTGVGLLGRRVGELLDELLLGSVGNLYFDDELAVGCADLLQRIAHQWQVARQDAVAGVPIGRADAQHRRITVERSHILEGREPDRFGHLSTQQLGHRCPQLIMVAHLHLRS